MRSRDLSPNEPEVELLSALLRLEPRRRREFGEVLVVLQLRAIEAPTEIQLDELHSAIDQASRQEWHRPWDEPIQEIFGPSPSQYSLAD